MEYSDLVYVCAINRIFNYHCRQAKETLEKFPSPGVLFSSGRKSLEDIFGPSSPYPPLFLDRRILDDSEREVSWAASKGVRILCYNEKEYPRRLKECEDSPILLFLAGNADLNAERIVSIVGTRKITSYGQSVCRQILKELSCLDVKPLIVSGLAYGVDICAHREALSLGLDTVGVMATGINEIYPSAHRADAAAMCAQGGILTEFWRGAPPNRYNFLRRNRIIAGLCDAIVLVESDKEGGGVVTSRMAFSYSRDVLAVPGRITDRWSSGCNALIGQKVAEAVTSPEGVLSCLGWKKRGNAPSVSSEPELFPSDSSVKRNIIVALSQGNPMDRDEIVEAAGADCQLVMRELTELEMEGRIYCDINGRYGIG